MLRKASQMAMTPEGKVKQVVGRKLKQLGAYYFFPATGGYGRSGVPDIIGCLDGMVFGIVKKCFFHFVDNNKFPLFPLFSPYNPEVLISLNSF